MAAQVIAMVTIAYDIAPSFRSTYLLNRSLTPLRRNVSIIVKLAKTIKRNPDNHPKHFCLSILRRFCCIEALCNCIRHLIVFYKEGISWTQTTLKIFLYSFCLSFSFLVIIVPTSPFTLRSIFFFLSVSLSLSLSYTHAKVFIICSS